MPLGRGKPGPLAGGGRKPVARLAIAKGFLAGLHLERMPTRWPAA